MRVILKLMNGHFHESSYYSERKVIFVRTTPLWNLWWQLDHQHETPAVLSEVVHSSKSNYRRTPQSQTTDALLKVELQTHSSKSNSRRTPQSQTTDTPQSQTTDTLLKVKLHTPQSQTTETLPKVKLQTHSSKSNYRRTPQSQTTDELRELELEKFIFQGL